MVHGIWLLGGGTPSKTAVIWHFMPKLFLKIRDSRKSNTFQDGLAILHKKLQTGHKKIAPQPWNPFKGCNWLASPHFKKYQKEKMKKQTTKPNLTEKSCCSGRRWEVNWIAQPEPALWSQISFDFLTPSAERRISISVVLTDLQQEKISINVCFYFARALQMNHKYSSYKQNMPKWVVETFNL